MRIRLSILLLVSVLTASAAVRTEHRTINFSEADFTLSYDDKGVLSIQPKDMASFPEGNMPGLPLFTFDVAVLGGHQYASSDVKYNKRLIKSDVLLAQTPKPYPTNVSIEDMADNPITYSADRRYPESNCSYLHTSTWTNISVVHFQTCPYEYDAAERKLYFIDSIELTFTISDDSADNSEFIAPCRTPDMIKSIVVNPQHVDEIMASYPAPQAVDDADRIDYVIVTKQELVDAFKPLLQWKRTKGFYTKIITMEEVEANYTGTDSAHKLKKCLYDLYLNNGLQYVLLGGDDTVVPVRGCYCCVPYIERENGKDIEKNEIDLNIPTDMYFACYGGDFEWDKNKNGLYGEVEDNISYIQYVYLTRLPIRTATDVSAFTHKLLKYEQNPAWTNKILMCGVELFYQLIQDGRDKNHSTAQIYGEELYNDYIKPFWNGERVRFYDTETDFPGGRNYDLNSVNFKEQLSKGYNFVDIITHGSKQKITLESVTQTFNPFIPIKPESYNYVDAIQQTNIGSTIITTTACRTNAFDSFSNKEGEIDDPCLSESFIRNEHSGVIAYVGCSRYGYIIPSTQYERHLYKNLFNTYFKDKSLGAVVSYAKFAMTPTINDGQVRWVQYGLNPIGDPEMPIFISEPQKFSEATVTTTNGITTIDTGVDECQICVMSANDDGKSYYKVFKETRTVSLSDLPAGYNICITKHNYIPKQFSCGHHFIQNETLSGVNNISGDIVEIGSAVTSTKPEGKVMIKGRTTIKAQTIRIESETIVEKDAELILINE